MRECLITETGTDTYSQVAIKHLIFPAFFQQKLHVISRLTSPRGTAPSLKKKTYFNDVTEIHLTQR